MPSNNKPDQLAAKPDGRISLTLDGKDYTLRRPKIGEQWKFDDAYVAIQQAERADAEWGLEQLGDTIDIEDGATVPTTKQILRALRAQRPEESATRVRARQTMLLDWWCEVFIGLGPEGMTLPTIEDMPPFLLNFNVVAQVRNAWSSNPADPGSE